MRQRRKVKFVIQSFVQLYLYYLFLVSLIVFGVSENPGLYFRTSENTCIENIHAFEDSFEIYTAVTCSAQEIGCFSAEIMCNY